MKTGLANLLWFFSCVPGWAAFHIAAWRPGRAQQRVLRRLMRENRDSAFGRKHTFDRIKTAEEFATNVPLAEYEGFATAIEDAMQGRGFALTAETPFLLEPTSGSTGKAKLIPQTHALRGEFRNAIAPWIASLYLHNPVLFLGKQYWVVSPSTPADFPKSVIPVGFSDDADYLGAVGRLVWGNVTARTPDAEQVRLVSVWHPSILSTRAGSRNEGVRVLSAWDGVTAKPHIENLLKVFPKARFQAKGLLATEGIVSFPLGMNGKKPLAIRSHYLEFVDSETGMVCGVAGLERGREYSVVLTTGGGLWRYRLHDVVRVTGFFRRTPCVEFVGKDNAVSDWVGEKLAERHCAEAMETAVRETGTRPLFAMVVPAENRAGYLLKIEWPTPDETLALRWSTVLEREFCDNFHYRHARTLGQLAPLGFEQVRNGAAEFLQTAQTSGARAGTVKIPALLTKRG